MCILRVRGALHLGPHALRWLQRKRRKMRKWKGLWRRGAEYWWTHWGLKYDRITSCAAQEKVILYFLPLCFYLRKLQQYVRLLFQVNRISYVFVSFSSRSAETPALECDNDPMLTCFNAALLLFCCPMKTDERHPGGDTHGKTFLSAPLKRAKPGNIPCFTALNQLRQQL